MLNIDNSLLEHESAFMAEFDLNGEYMYVRCAWCGTWMDIKPGKMNEITHSICDSCFKENMKSVGNNTASSSSSGSSISNKEMK